MHWSHAQANIFVNLTETFQLHTQLSLSVLQLQDIFVVSPQLNGLPFSFLKSFKTGKERRKWTGVKGRATHDGKKLFVERATMMPAMLTKPACRYWNCFFHQQSDFFEWEKGSCSVVELSAAKKRAAAKEVR